MKSLTIYCECYLNAFHTIVFITNNQIGIIKYKYVAVFFRSPTVFNYFILYNRGLEMVKKQCQVWSQCAQTTPLSTWLLQDLSGTGLKIRIS